MRNSHIIRSEITQLSNVMRLVQIFVFILLMGWILFAYPVAVQAVPPLPSSLYGTVKINNANVVDGTLVQALINEKVVAFSQTQTYQGESVYALDIPGDDSSTTAIEGGREGELISFLIGGVLARETATWHSATNVNLNLSSSSNETPLPPQPTMTLIPTPTAIQTINTPTMTAISSVLPTKTTTLATQVPSATLQPTSFTATNPPTQPVLEETTPVSSNIESTTLPTVTVPPGSTETEDTTGSTLFTSSPISLYWLSVPVVILLGCLIGLLIIRKRK